MPSLNILLRRLAHYAFYAAGGVVIVMCLVALVLKFWFMPDVDRFRPDLEAAASQAVGVPVRIGALAADWRGINPRLTLREVRLIPTEGEPLVLPEVEAIGSWWSLAFLEPRLARLKVDHPSLPLRKAPDGIIYLAGIAINGPGAPSPFPDWLLRQSRIFIKDAQIHWLDQSLDAPPLQLPRVRLRLENRFGRHRFGAVVQPSAAAARLDLRGDFKGRSVHAPQTWSGTLFAQVTQASFERWGQWVPWAQDGVKGGEGDLRFWLEVASGQVRSSIGDAHLRKLVLSMRHDLPDLSFETLTGRIGWVRGDSKTPSHSFFVDQLRFKAPNAAPAEPANLRLTLTPDGRGGFRRIETEASNLRLEALTALSGALPLPRRGHDLLSALAPRGLVESARGHWASPKDYALHLSLREGGVRAYETFPGISGLNLKLEATHQGGKATLTGTGFQLDWPQVFRHELGLTQLDAQSDWRFADQGLSISFQARRLANADLEGTAQGTLRLPGNSAPVVDIRGHLSRGEANAVYRYLPHKIGQEAYDWIRDGLVSGRSDDVRLTLKGDLGHFPFDKGGGDFRVNIRMVDGALDYADGWPRISGVHGQLVFHNNAMTLTADRGRILDALLGPVKVVIPDLHYTYDETAWVEGYARGVTRTFLDFVRQSPVDSYTNHFLSAFDAQGTGTLSLKLALPIRHLEDTTVGGAFTLHNNTVKPGPRSHELSLVNGAFTFTEKSVRGRGVQLHVLGLPAQLDLDSVQGGGLDLRLAGSINTETARPLLPDLLAGRVRGTTQWQLDVQLGEKDQATALTLTSDLAGMAVDLPPPLGKTASQSLPLTVVASPGQDGSNRITARYGTLARINALMPAAGGMRLNMHLGSGEAPEPTEPGLWVSGNLRFLDLDAWLAQDWGLEGEDGRPGDGGLPFRQASMNFGEVDIFDRRLHDTFVRLQPDGKGWNLKIAGKEVNGEVVTVPEKNGHRVLAQFKRLALPEPEDAGKPAASALPGDRPRLTHLDLGIQSLAWKKRELGEMRLRLSPVKTGYQVEHFVLAPPEGRLEGSGLVADHPRRPTRLNLKLSTQNLGKLLARLGHEDAIKGSEAELSGTLGWTGSPEDFNVQTLEGDLDFTAKKGQFLKVDPGAGRLVGVLSLQSLPRRVSLDFRDVFTQGFAFDEIAGRVHLEQGSAYTKDLRMNGPAATIRMSGVVNLAAETQNLKLQIQPRLEGTVAVAGALLGGPVVGLGTLLADKVLKNPIGQAAGFEYAVSGTWADPVINKVPRKAVKPEDQAP